MPDILAVLKRLTRGREPKVGDVYWVENQQLGIDDPDTEDHPIVVIAGQNVKGGPVTIAVGSSTRRVTKGHVILEVKPEDCEAGTRLDRLTRFWINENVRLEVNALGRFMGRLNESKRNELRRLKGTGIV